MSALGTTIGFLASAYLFRYYSSPSNIVIGTYKYKSYDTLRNKVVPSILKSPGSIDFEVALS